MEFTYDPNTILFLRVEPGAVATKTFTFHPQANKTEVEPYSKGLTKFRFQTTRVESVEDLYDLVRRATYEDINRQHFAVRGVPRDGLDPEDWHVKKYKGPEATISDAPLSWIVIDLDKVAETISDPVDDPASAAEELRKHLPPEFQYSKLVVRFSASQSVPGLEQSRGKASAHIWAMLSEPKTCARLKQWAKVHSANGYKLDLAMYQPAQPIYTAAPIFKGMDDPLWSGRVVLLDGEYDDVTLEQPQTKHAALKPSSNGEGFSQRHSLEFQDHLALAGGESGHIRQHILAALGVAVREAKGAVDREALKNAIRNGVEAHGAFTARDRADADQYLSDEHLDALIQYCIDQEHEKNGLVEAVYPYQLHTLEAAQELAEKEIRDFFDLIPTYQVEVKIHLAAERRAMAGDGFYVAPHPMPPVRGVNVDTGVGKSRIAFQEIANFFVRNILQGQRSGYVLYLIPTHKLGHEQADDAQRLIDKAVREAKVHGIPVAQYRGRSAANPSGGQMCLDPERIALLEGLGSMATKACGAGSDVCPHFDECPYQRQRGKIKDVVKSGGVIFSVHHLAFGPAPYEFLRHKRPSALVMDENHVGAALTVGEMLPVARVTEMRSVNKTDQFGNVVPDLGATADLRDLFLRVGAAIEAHGGDGPLVRHHFEANQITYEECRLAEKLEIRTRCEDGIKPGMPLDEVRPLAQAAAAAANKFIPLRRRFWLELAEWLEGEHLTCPTLRIHKTSGVIQMNYRKPVAKWATCPTLLLDATMSERLVRHSFPQMPKVENIRVEMPNVYIRQVTNTTNVNATFLVREDDTDDKRRQKANAVNRERRAIEFASAMFKDQGTSISCLIDGERREVQHDFMWAGTKPLYEAVLDGWEPPKNGVVTYYTRAVGTNEYEGVAYIRLFGRTEPPVEQAEIQGAAICRAPVQEIVVSNTGERRYQKEDKLIYRKGDCGVRVPASVHPDPDVNAVLESICKSNLVQAAGRGRGVRRSGDAPLLIDIVTNVPSDFLVDETFLHHERLPNEFDLMALDGVMPGSNKDAAALYPNLFKNEEAVKNKRRMKATKKGGLNPYKNIYIGNSPPFSDWQDLPAPQRHAQGRPLVDSRFEYRLEGERGPWKVCHFRQRDIPFEQVLERFEKALGRPVVVSGGAEWLAGCEPPETPISKPTPIDVDPEPQVIEFRDDDHICEFFGLNRQEQRGFKRACEAVSGDNKKTVMTQKLATLVTIIGSSRFKAKGVTP